MKLNFVLVLLLIFSIEGKKISFLEKDAEKPKGKVQGVIHFINCGRADSILIEQNGRYGLIDSSNPYAGAEDVVEPAGKRAEKSPDRSAQAVVNYLENLEVKHLDWILSTHAHSDHIGGMPQIAYHFVDEGTKFLYKEYRKNREDNTELFQAAINSMKKKGATLIDLTDKKYGFDFGEMHFELINTNIHNKEEKSGENQNSIASIVTFGDKKIFLAADLEIADDLIYKDQIGKADVLKMSHHGFGDNSFEFLSTVRPNYSIIMNYEFPKYILVPAAFLQQIVGGEIYYTGGVSTTTEDVENSAIRLYLYEDTSDDSEDKKYSLYFENTGGNHDIGDTLEGLQTYRDFTFYFEKGKIVTGLQTIEGESCQYYFGDDGYMIKDDCVTIDEQELCFDENGCLDK